MSAEKPVQISIGAVLAASLGAAVRGAQAQLGQLGSTMAELGNRQSGIRQLETMRAQAADAARAMRAAQQKVAGLEAGIAGQAGAATARQVKELERARAASDRTEQAFRSQRAAVDELATSLQRAGVNTRAMGAEAARLGGQMETLRTRTDALTRAQQAQATNLENRDAYREQAVDAVALGASLYGLLQPAIAFESVMADVRKVVNFETPDQFGQMGRDVLLMSTRIPMAAEGIGAIVAAAGQAGIAREELLRFAEDAAKMGVAFDLSGQQAGAAMTGLRSIFGLTQDDAVKLGDAINHLSNNMDAKASDLLNISNRAGSTARMFGLTGAQLGALSASFLALKTPPEVAATGINALLLRLSTADRQSAAFQQSLQDIGLSATDMKQMIEQDAQGALTTFLQHVKNAPDVMGTLTDLFGLEYADDIAKLVGSLETYEKAVGLVADQTAYAGSMQREFEQRSNTTANNLQLLRNQVGRLGITIGSVLLPTLNSMAAAVSGPVNYLTSLAERFPFVTQVVMGTVGAVIALQVATIALGFAWTFVSAPFLAAVTAFHSARAGLALLQVQAAATGASTSLLAIAWQRLRVSAIGLVAPIKAAAVAFWAMLPAIGATTAALLANPITWIVVGIGAAVAGLVLVIRKYWDPLAAYVGGVFEGIRSAVQPAIASLSAALAPLAPIGNAVAAVFGFIASGLSSVVSGIGALLAPVTLTAEQFDGMTASGQTLGTVIGSVLSAAFTLLTLPLRAVGTLAGWVIEGFTALVSFSPLALISAAWQPVADFMTGLWAGITAAIGQAINWIASKIGWVLNAGKKVGSWIGSLTGRGAAAPAAPTVAAPAQRPPAVGASVARAPAPAQAAPRPPAVGAMVAAAPPAPAPAPAPAARPVPMPAQPVAASSKTVNNHVTMTAPITVNAPPGMDAREIAALIESRLRALLRETTRSPAAAMHD